MEGVVAEEREAGAESVPAAREDGAGSASKDTQQSLSSLEAKAAAADSEPAPADTGAPAQAAAPAGTAACPANGSSEAREGGSGSPGPPEGAEAKKALGNTAFQAKKFAEAVRHYSEAILEAGDAAPGVYFSNRAVCRAALGDWAAARSDAAEALKRPGGLTKKALYQKARAELRLQLAEEAEATLRLAGEQGLRADVEKLLKEDFRSASQASPAAAPAACAPVSAGAASAATASTATAGAAAAGAPAASSAPADAAAKAKDAGNAKYKEGAYREALADYRRALELLPPGDAERRAPLLGNVAAACLMLRRVDECISVCEQSLALDSQNAKIRSRLATAQVALGDFTAARAVLAAAEGGDAAALANAVKLIDESERQLAAADAALSGGEPAKALGMLAELETKALFSCPAVSLKMGRCYLELKNYPRVLNTTQQVLRANPRNIDALVLRSEALYRNNDAGVDSAQWTDPLEQGQRLLKEALSFDPDHAVAQALRKRLRQLCGSHSEFKAAFSCREFEKAQETLDQMIEQGQDNPVMLASLYCERAKCGIRLKDWPRVLKDVGQATYRNHGLVQPYLYRAQALQALDRHEDAVKELEGLLSWHREQSVYEKLQEAKFLLRKKKRANYYELLGVPTVASQLEIKKAYRERAAEWHPDKKGHLDEAARKNAEEMFKRIGEAYEVLTDAQKKDYYDKGYDLEGIDEQIELKKRRTEAHGHGQSHGQGHGHCGSGHCC